MDIKRLKQISSLKSGRLRLHSQYYCTAMMQSYIGLYISLIELTNINYIKGLWRTQAWSDVTGSNYQKKNTEFVAMTGVINLNSLRTI